MGEDAPASEAIPERYVAFCDILGFSNRILTDFENTINIYRGFTNLITNVSLQDVELTIYSDAILVVGESLGRVLSTVQTLWFAALAHDLMLRGAITRGNYWSSKQENHLFVASDALVRAVKLESAIGIPAVCVADDIEIPDDYWLARFAQERPLTPLLHFRDRNIVNPFSVVWLRSAKVRATKLMEESPAHKDKYLWFLALYDAVLNNNVLIPPDVYNRFITQGIIKPSNQSTPPRAP